ncbi:hypothetical protein GCM10022408_38110 [Hymenobacter fastidiosus]|uniref:Type I restriction modification DNA specificity domain-containing protein n=1 Tax=Hymenobacter fastidiosus TaxID=486264 RepID=A0ABP7T3L2_9BACT
MKKYEETRDSGINWLGEIPAHWKLKKLKYCVALNTNEGEIEDITTRIALENIESKTGKYLATETPAFEGIGNLFNSGDVLFSKLRPYLAKVLHAETSGIAVGEVLVLTPDQDEYESRFLFYRLLSQSLIDIVDSSTYGSKMPRASWGFIGELKLPVPPLPEQRAIAAYLDRKTAQLDTLLAQKETLLQKLHQKRQALINEAVTQGLDPAAPRKPSGVAWLGDVPAHWEVKKLRYAVDFFNTVRVPLSSEERGRMASRTYDYYGASGIIDKVEDYHFDGDYILLAEDGANLLSRSTALAFKATGKFWVNNHAHILRPKHGNLDYFVNLLESLDYSMYVTGSAQPKLTMGNLAEVILPVPPLGEQEIIQEHLQKISQKISKATTAIHTQIQTLKAFRQSLISEVVTGKVDVRPAVLAPEADLPLWQQ